MLTFLRYGKRARDGVRRALGAGLRRQLLRAPHHEYRIGLPRGGRWREVLNTDSEGYGGSGVGNLGGVEAVAESWHGQPSRRR